MTWRLRTSLLAPWAAESGVGLARGSWAAEEPTAGGLSQCTGVSVVSEGLWLHVCPPWPLPAGAGAGRPGRQDPSCCSCDLRLSWGSSLDSCSIAGPAARAAQSGERGLMPRPRALADQWRHLHTGPGAAAATPSVQKAAEEVSKTFDQACACRKCPSKLGWAAGPVSQLGGWRGRLRPDTHSNRGKQPPGLQGAADSSRTLCLRKKPMHGSQNAAPK